jgi:G:T-mismatch repair DNA endonuclease (very short patch repair protein)
MADMFTKKKRSAIMASIHSRGSAATEGALLFLFRRNRIIGWRRHLALEGQPDFAFPQAKVVIFVDGWRVAVV